MIIFFLNLYFTYFLSDLHYFLPYGHFGLLFLILSGGRLGCLFQIFLVSWGRPALLWTSLLEMLLLHPIDFVRLSFLHHFSGGIFWFPLYFHYDSSFFSSMLSLITAWNWVIDVASTCAIYWPHPHTFFLLLYVPPINKDGINYLAWKAAHQAETGERYANLKSWCFSSYKKWTGNRREMIVQFPLAVSWVLTGKQKKPQNIPSHETGERTWNLVIEDYQPLLD